VGFLHNTSDDAAAMVVNAVESRATFFGDEGVVGVNGEGDAGRGRGLRTTS